MPRPAVTKPKISATKTFVDRQQPLELFKETAAKIPEDSSELLIFYGVGGQGKTALRKQFEEVLKKDPSFSHIHSAVLDLHERKTIDPDLALLFIRNELAQSKKISFQAFDLAFGIYWQKAYPERKMPEFSNSWREASIGITADYITEVSKVAVAGMAEAFIEGTPFIGPPLRRGAAYGVKEGHKQLSLKTSEALKTAFPNGIPEKPVDIETKLPYLLASDLEKQMVKNKKRRFIIFIDEYERVFKEGGFASKTRDNPFDKTVRALVTELKGTLVVILSREQLPWAEFAPVSVSNSEWRKWIQEAHHRLGGLSPLDAEKFLLAVPVREKEIRQAIIDGSGAKLTPGEENPIYPLLLDLQVDHYVNLKNQANPELHPEEFAIHAESFRDLRNQIFNRLLREYGQPFESTLKRLSVARYFDHKLFEYIVKKYVTGFPLDRFDELAEMSFVEESTSENVFKIHSSIRETLQEFLSPEDLTKTHEAFVEYYTPLATPFDCKSITDTNIDALIELVYHKCILAPDQVVAWWDEFSKPYDNGAIIRQLEPSLRLMHDTAETVLGPNHIDTAQSLNNLANNLNAQGKYSEAQSLYERALKIAETELGLNHTDTAQSLNNLANNLNDQGKYSPAQLLNERALKIRETELGPNHLDTAISLNELAISLNTQGKYSEAQPLYQRALKIRETELGPNHPDTTISLNNLAYNLSDQGKYSEAQLLYERALKIRETELGPNNPGTALSLNNLANNLNDQGKYSEAQLLHERALKIYETESGPNHPDTALSLDNLASTLSYQGKYSEAQLLYERALKIRETELRPNHPDTAISLNNFACNLDAQGKYSEAQPLYERALQICETELRPNHPNTATSLNNLAYNLDAQGKYSQAQPLYERALKFCETELGPNHLDTTISLNNLANNLDAQGKYSQAQPLYERALKIRETELGPNHPDTIITLNNLANNLKGQGKNHQANVYLKRT